MSNIDSLTKDFGEALLAGVQVIEIIDCTSGCHWVGNTLVHTDACQCDEAYQEWKDLDEN